MTLYMPLSTHIHALYIDITSHCTILRVYYSILMYTKLILGTISSIISTWMDGISMYMPLKGLSSLLSRGIVHGSLGGILYKTY